MVDTPLASSTGIPPELAACVAPLPSTLVQHSFALRWAKEASLTPVYSSEQAAGRFQTVWNQYVKEVRQARLSLMQELDTPVDLDKVLSVRKKRLGAPWLRRQLAQFPGDKGKPRLLSPDTITKLVEHHVLRRDSWGIYDWQSVSALLLCRMLDHERERGWLPEQVPPEEAWWWCWSQDYPGAPLIPCPYPAIPINLSNSTLLYTRWAGASWSDDAWIKIGYLGAITFAGLIRDVRSGTPTMHLHDLEPWEPGISKHALPPFPLDLETEETEEHLASPALDASYSLMDALAALEHYQKSGLLKAPVSHLPGIRGGKGQATLQLHAGQVVQRLITDQKGQTHPIDGALLAHLDTRYGPFAWTFHRFSSEALLRNMQYQQFFRDQVITVLKRLSLSIFSTPQIDDL